MTESDPPGSRLTGLTPNLQPGSWSAAQQPLHGQQPLQGQAVPRTRREQARRRHRRRAAGVVGVIGELLITLGLLLGLYVVWEVFWTNVEASAVAEEVLKTATETPDWIEPAVEQGPAPHYSYRTDPPPVDENPLSTPAIGGVWASLHVPRWGLAYNVPIVEGTDKKTILDRGMIGHYPNTAGPGQIGNFATAAHRITYGEPYAKIETLQNGDSLIVETARYYFVYKVYASQIVLPDAIGVTWPVPNDAGAVPTRRIITLTTCHPRWASTHRYVVWGELEYWADKAEGYLEELEG